MRTHVRTGWKGIRRHRDVDAARGLMTLSLAAIGAGWRTAPSLWQLPSRAISRGKRAALLDWNKTSAHISSAGCRFFPGCEASPQDVNAWTGHIPSSQDNTKRLCCDKPEINCRYYVSAGSAVCYIRGQGVSYVLTQSYIISHIHLNGSGPRTVALYYHLWRWQRYFLAIGMSIKAASMKPFWRQLGILKSLGMSTALSPTSSVPMPPWHRLAEVKRSSWEMTWYNGTRSGLLRSCDAEGMQFGTRGLKDKNSTRVHFCSPSSVLPSRLVSLMRNLANAIVCENNVPTQGYHLLCWQPREIWASVPSLSKLDRALRLNA